MKQAHLIFQTGLHRSNKIPFSGFYFDEKANNVYTERDINFFYDEPQSTWSTWCFCPTKSRCAKSKSESGFYIQRSCGRGHFCSKFYPSSLTNSSGSTDSSTSSRHYSCANSPTKHSTIAKYGSNPKQCSVCPWGYSCKSQSNTSNSTPFWRISASTPRPK